VDGLGLALRIEICAAEDGFTPDKAMVDKMCDVAMSGALQARGHRYGLVLDVGGYYKNVITLAPSLEISDEEIDLALELLDQLFTRCVRRPFLG
jgi:4-aminobutyrate aminotransferase / (S)-3-amino-2-methylpropionate transaminase / 5-aminovalerate transaminase